MQARALPALPIDPYLKEAVARIEARSNLVVVAEPGAGKTTRLPRALLDAGLAEHGEIVVLEPRRLATRMAAARVAHELGEPLGERIGYQVRFEERVSSRTRVRFLTEGVLTRKLVGDGSLERIAVVVLDELHERSLEADLALAMLRALQRTRAPHLKLVAMSATLDAEPLARFLECDVLRVPGRTFPVEIEHDPHDGGKADRPLHERVAASVKRVLRRQASGDVLVFLPGAGEIRRAHELLERDLSALGVELAVLHGDLPAREQDRAVTPGARRKVILSTNVAESSLTIEGVCIVIDSGLARVASHSPWSGLPQLVTAKISKASATQRAGRAGRMGPGLCVRLYSEHDFDSRPAFDKPEIARADLSQACLSIAGSGLALGPEGFLDPPPAPAMAAARGLLALLGALDGLDGKGAITELGRRMLKLPLHPRLARIALEASARGLCDEGALIAALLSERDIAREGRASFGSGRKRNVERGPSDVLDRLDRFEQAGGSASGARALDLDPGAVSQVARVHERLRAQLCRAETSEHSAPADDAGFDAALLIAVLSGFGDRVAKRRAPGSSALVLGRGGSLNQAESSVVRDAELVCVLDAREGGREKLAYLVSAIEPEWLLELWPERVTDIDEVRFEPSRERVEAVTGLCFEGIVLDQRTGLAEPSPRTSALLAQAARERNVLDFAAVERFERRVAHACRADASLSPLPPDAREQAVLAACEGMRTLGELRDVRLLDAFMGITPAAILAALDRLAPESLRLPSGRSLPIHYESDRPPWVASRLQDFFGMKHGPKLGSVPLVLHLLAPNQRPVQVTTDLEGFWQRHYPTLRRELMRRYPKHSWPEDPLHAEPPAPRQGPPRARRGK